MTPERQDLVLDLMHRRVDEVEFLRRWGARDGAALGLELVRRGVAERDDVTFEFGLIVAHHFGISDEHVPSLLQALGGGWHQKDEDIVEHFSWLADHRFVDVLERGATWVPDYLEWDDARAMAVKAVYGLGRTPGMRAREVLVGLLGDESDPIRECAAYQLGLRSTPWDGDEDDVGEYSLDTLKGEE